MSVKNNGRLILPCLRGTIGDWTYYSTLLPFKEIAARISMADEIHSNKELSRWIQRKIGDRIPAIVDYLREQDQRFFNSIIVGIYGGQPSWQELTIYKEALNEEGFELTEEEADYLDRTFGVLRLSGEEEMFAIDGQHRTAAIKEVLKSSDDLENEEVPIVFVAHKKTKEGEVRTRRLFSTLNRYAKPVSPSEIIALDEEDNGAILTRRLIEQYPLFETKIALNKGRSISPSNKKEFTNIVLLYDFVIALLTEKVFISSIEVGGFNFTKFTTRRLPEDQLNELYETLVTVLDEIVNKLPFLKDFFETGFVDRKDPNTNLLFRPVGQIVFFNTYRIAAEYEVEEEVLDYFAQDTFNVTHPVWQKIFVDQGTKNLITTQEVQRAAILLLLQKFKIAFTATPKDKAILENLAISVSDLE